MKKDWKISIIDIINFLFWFVILVFYIFTFNQSEYKLQGFLLFSILAIFEFVVIWFRSKEFKNYIIKFIVLFYPAVFLISIFDSLYMVLPYINNNLYDEAIANIDFWLFGFYPTVAIESIINPYLTEIMYYLYAFYFPMPLIILLYLLISKRFTELDKSMFFLFITYYGSYLLYFAFPALGPRYYEPIVSLQTVPLDGVFLTEDIRNAINYLEYNKFDAFPSLHTAISLATLIIVGKYRIKWLYFFVPVIIGIFISLIYCRYHYFFDIIAGVIWTLVCFWIVEKFYDKVFTKHFVPFYS